MTGVGYDLEDLSKSKFLPTNPKTIEKNKRKREQESQREAAEAEKQKLNTVDERP
jgi:hypothetical protein